jgi:hypothetical protein
VRLVVSCSARKSASPLDGLLARDLPETVNTVVRAKEWIRRLEQASGPLLVPSDLYRGEQWTVVSGLPTEAQQHGWAADLWVASAGYGLISTRAPLRPYAATFASGHPDSVVLQTGPLRLSALRLWWQALTAWHGPELGAPRSLRELAASRPVSPMVVALGATYLAAITEDLIAARHELAHPSLLTVVSVGTHRSEFLGGNLLSIDTAARELLGGSCLSLNARLARWIVATAGRHAFDASRVARLAAAALTIDNPRTNPRRAPQPDATVLRFIQQRLAGRPRPRKTTLLRAFRDTGRACEQERFHRLYARALAETAQ